MSLEPLLWLHCSISGRCLLLACRGTSLIRNRPTLGPYSRPMPRALWLSEGGWRFLMSEVSLSCISVRHRDLTPPPIGLQKSLLNLWRRTVNLRRAERARNEGTTGPNRLDDTRCTTYTRRINTLRGAVSRERKVHLTECIDQLLSESQLSIRLSTCC